MSGRLFGMSDLLHEDGEGCTGINCKNVDHGWSEAIVSEGAPELTDLYPLSDAESWEAGYAKGREAAEKDRALHQLDHSLADQRERERDALRDFVEFVEAFESDHKSCRPHHRLDVEIARVRALLAATPDTTTKETVDG